MKLNIRRVLAFLLTLIIATNFVSCTDRARNPSSDTTVEFNKQIVELSEVKWESLNPARGDKSPKAGTLWGDRNGTVPTGFLAQFIDGFSSPPHIHNVTYRAVVISGLIHNDDPDAAKMWMPVGSFWTQPKGETHITAAKGDINIALVEIDQGPYLVRPADEEYDSGERPVNVDASNVVWVDPPGTLSSDRGGKLAYLWGNLAEGQENGTFLKLPAGFIGKILTQGKVFRAVVTKGQLQYFDDIPKTLEPGSYFSSKGEAEHQISSQIDAESILYIRTDGQYQLIQD